MAAANSAYDPTVIVIEIIQSIQSQQQTATDQPNQPPAPPQAAKSDLSATSPESGLVVSPNQDARANTQTAPAAREEAQTVATTANMNPNSYSPMENIGPFGWVGIGFLFCLLFALIINIYLKRQKKEMDVPPTKEQLEELAPGAMENRV